MTKLNQKYLVFFDFCNNVYFGSKITFTVDLRKTVTTMFGIHASKTKIVNLNGVVFFSFSAIYEVDANR